MWKLSAANFADIGSSAGRARSEEPISVNLVAYGLPARPVMQNLCCACRKRNNLGGSQMGSRTTCSRGQRVSRSESLEIRESGLRTRVSFAERGIRATDCFLSVQNVPRVHTTMVVHLER